MINEMLLETYRMGAMLRERAPMVVYRGVDSKEERDVLITLLEADIIASRDFSTRFEPFVQALAQLDDPHLAALLDYGEHDGQAVVVQEFVEGETLAELVGDGEGLPVDLVLDLAEQIGESLKSLHQADLVHGWLHLESVVLSAEGTVRLFDAGLAQGMNLSQLLASGRVEAEPYHAPELRAGEGLSPCTDFYALGVMLYRALTAELPIDPQNPWPGNQRPGLPPELDQLVAKCLHPDPAQRIQSAAEFLAGIEEVRRGMQVGAGDTILGMEDALVGHTLGSYQVVERLGQGGMATVYKAYEPNLDRYVAIKVLPQFFARDPNFMQRFRREAKAVAQLNHPNIMPIYSYGEEDDITYIAMQFVEGGTLKQGRGHVYDPGEAIRLALPVVRALAYAHKRGIVHRDIKPSNVLITEDGWPVLADFGLAKMAEASGKLTGTGVGVGTPMYMSPEQGQGIDVDHRTDIYSMGIMLYEMLTGDVPFRADTPMAIVIKHMTAPLPMPREINPDIPEALERIILKATAKDSQDRYQTAEEMVTALERALNLVQAGRDEPLPPLEAVTPSKPAAKPEAERGTGIGKMFKTAAIALGGLIGVILLGVILMAVFDICPPPGPWPIPPWCEGTPYRLPGVEGEEAAATPMVTEGRLGGILFQDDFEGGISPRWQFTASEYLGPWQAEKADGRTVMRSVPPSGGDFNAAEIRGTNWENYAIQFDFRFDQPDQFGEHYIWLRGRITDCPPTIPSLQAYSIIVTAEQVWLEKAFCENQSAQQLIQSDRDIAVDQWHTLQYIFIGNRIQVYLDGEKYLDYPDIDEPIDGGDLWIETGAQNEILFDNLRVYEIILDEEGDLAASLPTATGEAPVQDQTDQSVSWEGRALRLDGQDSYVEIPYSEDLNLDQALTLEAWINVAFDEQQCAYGLCGFAPIISQGHGGSSMGNYTLFVYPGHVGFGFEPIDSKLIAPGQFQPGWNHVAAVHTFGDDRNSQLYLNGEPLIDGQWTDDAGDVIDGNAPYLPNSGGPYWIGRLGLEEIYFPGSIDEIRIWNVARSGSEIEAAMNTELSGDEEGLVAYWRIDEASDSEKIFDIYGNDGTLRGNAQIEAFTDFNEVRLPILENSSASGEAEETTTAVDDPVAQARAFADPILTTIADRSPDYADDFSDQSSGWPTGSDANGEWGYEDDAAFISVVGSNVGNKLEDLPLFSDFVLEIDGEFVSGEWGFWNVEFRDYPKTMEHPTNATYAVGFRPDGVLNLWKNVDKVHIDLLPYEVTSPVFETGLSTNRLTLIAKGPQIAVYMNGEPLWYVSDQSSGRGKFGLGAENDGETPLRVQFDNLKIWDISEADPESVDSSDADSLCDFTLDNVGERATVAGTIGFTDESSPGFWYADLAGEDGCMLGVTVNKSLHGEWFDQVPEAFELGASIVVQGRFVSYPYPHNPDELQLILELDEQPRILSPDD